MARKPHEALEVHIEPKPMPENHALAAAETELREIAQNAVMLADKIGYDGPLTLGGAEDHARMQMRRTVNECLELGKTLLIIKELTPHGGFRDRIELLGFEYKTAAKFMQATLKFSNVSTSRHLTESINTQAKLLELLVLDDDEIKELGENGSTRGVNLDDIESMTTRELRAALRKERDEVAQDLAAKDKLIQTQTEQIQKLHKMQQRIETATPDEVGIHLRKEASALAITAENAVGKNLRNAFEELSKHDGQHSEFMLGLISQIELATAVLRADYGLLKAAPDGDTTPYWERGATTPAVN